MNPKLGIGILFAIPTILITYIYYAFGINNIWQLFMFAWMVAVGYMPGIMCYIYIYQIPWIKKMVQKNLQDF